MRAANNLIKTINRFAKTTDELELAEQLEVQLEKQHERAPEVLEAAVELPEFCELPCSIQDVMLQILDM